MSTAIDDAALDDIARNLRLDVLEVTKLGGAAHIASCLSVTDVVVAAYWGVLNIDPKNPSDPDRDRFILSKGHAAVIQYAALARRGFFDYQELRHFNQDGSWLQEHPGSGLIPGIEVATGSLGHGLPLGLGMAFAAKLEGRTHRVFVAMSDGECNEGSVWEAALVAPAKGLDNVCAIIDFNKWQATDRSQEVTSLHSIRDKFEAFGWSAHHVDGHDTRALIELMNATPDGSGKPVAIVADTVKGKGISFMEDDNNWHYRVPTDEEIERAREELGLVGRPALTASPYAGASGGASHA